MEKTRLSSRAPDAAASDALRVQHLRLAEIFYLLILNTSFPSQWKCLHSNSGMKMHRDQLNHISGKSMVLTHQSKMYQIQWVFLVMNSMRCKWGLGG